MVTLHVDIVHLRSPTEPKKLSKGHWLQQKRVFGKFVKEKKNSKRRHPGIGRICPNCKKKVRDSTSLRYHLLSTACPYGRIDDKDLPEMLLKAQALAKLQKCKEFQQPTEKTEAKDGSLKVNVTVNNSIPLSMKDAKHCSPTVLNDCKDINQYIEDFKNSFENPLFGSSNRAPSTLKKIIDSVKKIISTCQFTKVSDLFSNASFDSLKIPFRHELKFGTKKSMCQALIEFVEFLDFCDDVQVEEKRRVQLLYTLRKAYDSFCKGCAIDNASRRVKLSEAIRTGALPTYAEVTKTYDIMLKKVPVLCYSNFNKF